MAGRGTLEEKAGKIRTLILDVDGVLTDGRIVLDGRGGESKAFDVKDGQRIVMAARHGLRVIFLTGRRSEAVLQRAAELKVERVLQGEADKGAALSRLMAEEQLGREQIAYLGDDLADLPAMRMAGLAGAVGDAAPEVIEAADWVSSLPGGRGAVREFVELLLRSRELWGRAMAEFAG